MERYSLPTCQWRQSTPGPERHACNAPYARRPRLIVSSEECQLCRCPNCSAEQGSKVFSSRKGCGRRVSFRSKLKSLWLRTRRWRTFLKAFTKHLLYGLPHATEEQQAKRRANCKDCWRRDKVRDVCRICECKLGESGLLPNKVRWAGEHCPLWRAEKPNEWWGPVKGETIWVRWRKWLVARVSR